MEFNKKGKLVGITEKNYYASFKLKLPNYLQFEENSPTYDLFLIKPKAKPVFIKHLKEKINRNERSKLLY